MSEIVSSLTSAFTLAFVVTSMFGLGLGLTIRDIVEPLRNGYLVTLSAEWKAPMIGTAISRRKARRWLHWPRC